MFQVDALTAKQAAIEVELSTVYEKEQEETELFLADLKTRRVEVEREAYRMRQEIYRAAQTPQLMEVNMETMEGLVFESARAADEAALAAEEAEEMFREAESALKDAELAVEATNAAVKDPCFRTTPSPGYFFFPLASRHIRLFDSIVFSSLLSSHLFPC